jgi:hypothetical protein
MSRQLPILPTNQISRRQSLQAAGAGFGYLALQGLLGAGAPRLRAAEQPAEKPLAPKSPHFPTKAKRIIFCFMQGCISPIDTFEYKAAVQNNDGKVGPGGDTLTASKFKFAQYGETGTWMSELFPHLAKQVDKLCWLRGLHTDTPAHPQAVIQLHTGTALASLTRPSMGAWLTYGFGYRESGSAWLHHDQPAAELWWRGELWQCVFACTFSRNKDQRPGLCAELESGYADCAAAEAT